MPEQSGVQDSLRERYAKNHPEGGNSQDYNSSASEFVLNRPSIL